MREPEYQWPSEKFFPKKFLSAPSKRKALRSALEDFFSTYFQHECVLAPSARAAISLILKAEGYGRAQSVFASPWSSHCVWSAVTPYSRPVSSFDEKPNAVIAVHKFGILSKFKSPYSGLIIEDSCDSLITSPSALFPNEGKYEIVSLPKVTGIAFGGLIICKDKNSSLALKKMSSTYSDFNEFCAKLRWNHPKNNPSLHWDDIEHKNFSISYAALKNMEENLEKIQSNRKTIESRVANIKESKIPSSWISQWERKIGSARLAPNFLVPQEILKSNPSKKLMARKVNFSGFIEAPEYKSYVLLPLHFGVSEKNFIQLLQEVEQNL